VKSPIVIIGGMGPQASLRFHDLLIEKSKQHHNGDGDQFPHIVHFSLPVVEFLGDQEKMEQAIRQLNRHTELIEQLRPTVITLACNTAHILRQEVDIMRHPAFVALPDIVSARIKQDGVRKIGLLASPTAIRTKLYEETLRKNGVATVRPRNSELSTLEMAIRSVITGSGRKNAQIELSRLAHSLVAGGAEAILLGCTELPLLFDVTQMQVPTYDCLHIYADAVINHYYLNT
jgi:aspartate racemase